MSLYNTGHVKWATSCGGPLILMPRALLSQWMGVYRWFDETQPCSDPLETEQGALCVDDDFLNPETSDYGRACNTKELRSFLHVAGERALILDNEDNDDNPATWLAFPEARGGILFQWNYLHVAKEQDQLVEEAFRQHHTLSWQNEALWEIKHPELVLFDSATAGALLHIDEDECLTIPTKPGVYSLATAEYHYGEDFKVFTLHRLMRV